MKKRVIALVTLVILSFGMLVGCAKKEERIMWVGDRNIMSEEYTRYINWTKFSALKETGKTYAESKNTSLQSNEGQITTYENIIFEDSQRLVLRVALVEKLRAENGLSDDAKVKGKAEELYQNLLKEFENKNQYGETIKKYNLTDKDVKAILLNEAREKQLAETIYLKTIDPSLIETATKMEMALNYGRLKLIIISKIGAKEQPLDDEQLKAKKAKYEEALKKAQSGENFDDLITKYSDAQPGTDESRKYGYVVRWSEFQENEEQLQFYNETPVGTVAGRETDSNYYILQKLAPEEKEVYELYKEKAYAAMCMRELDILLGKETEKVPYYLYEDLAKGLMNK